MNRRALYVLVATFGAALAMMLWLVAEMKTAASSAGPPPTPAAGATTSPGGGQTFEYAHYAFDLPPGYEGAYQEPPLGVFREFASLSFSRAGGRGPALRATVTSRLALGGISMKQPCERDKNETSEVVHCSDPLAGRLFGLLVFEGLVDDLGGQSSEARILFSGEGVAAEDFASYEAIIRSTRVVRPDLQKTPREPGH